MNKYEKLIEYIINENEQKARELFHEIVVEKSRDIYESIMDEEQMMEFGGDEQQGLADEVTQDETGGLAEEGDETDFDLDAAGGDGDEEAARARLCQRPRHARDAQPVGVGLDHRSGLHPRSGGFIQGAPVGGDGVEVDRK